MGAEETSRIVEGFLTSGRAHWLAEDIDLEDLTSGVRLVGRPDVDSWLDRRRDRPLTGATTADLRVIASGDEAAAEWTCRAITPANHRLEIAHVGFYDVRGGEIVRARLYCGPVRMAGSSEHNQGDMP